MLGVRALAVLTTASLAASGCAGDDDASSPCDGLVVNVELAAPLSSDIQSFLVQVDGDEGVRRAVIEAGVAGGETGTRLEVPDLGPGPGVVDVSAYAEPMIRGSLLAEGRAPLDDAGACGEVDVLLAAPTPTAPDGGIARADAGQLADAGSPRDAGPGDLDPDAGTPPPSCGSDVDQDTLMFLAVDGDVGSSTLTDAAGDWRATLRPRGATIGVTDGPPGCGEAFAVFGGVHAVVDGSGELAPASGSVDFWVRFDGPADRQGIISRDASGQQNPGHFTVFRTCDNRVVLRIQDEVESYYRCSDVTIDEGRWAHVGVNLGPPGVELWVDGAASTATAAVGLWGTDCNTPVPCDQRPQLDITGNGNPWVIGADTGVSAEGGADPVRAPFRGALDAIRVSAGRRDFGL